MPARYRLRPVAPHDVVVCGLLVPAAGAEVEVGGGASRALDLEVLQHIDRTGLCHIERLPDPADPPSREAQTATDVAREPAPDPERGATGEPPEPGSALADRDPPGASGASGGESARASTRRQK